MQEQSMKLEFIWPHLDQQQRAAHQALRPASHVRRPWAAAALKPLLHSLALCYLLAASLVLGRLAARHLVTPAQQQLLPPGQCPAQQ
jgi:hypothetical protein